MAWALTCSCAQSSDRDSTPSTSDSVGVGAEMSRILWVVMTLRCARAPWSGRECPRWGDVCGPAGHNVRNTVAALPEAEHGSARLRPIVAHDLRDRLKVPTGWAVRAKTGAEHAVQFRMQFVCVEPRRVVMIHANTLATMRVEREPLSTGFVSATKLPPKSVKSELRHLVTRGWRPPAECLKTASVLHKRLPTFVSVRGRFSFVCGSSAAPRSDHR